MKLIQVVWWLVSLLKVALLKGRYPQQSFTIGSSSRLHASAQLRIYGRPPGGISIGERTTIRGELLALGRCGRIEVGDDCYIGRNTYVWAVERISIGNRVLIAHNVNILDNLTHPISAQARHRQAHQILAGTHPTEVDLGERPVSIGDDAWVGTGAIILRGVTLGEGAIVGAGAVVTDDVPPWAIVAGNPARMVRTIAEEER